MNKKIIWFAYENRYIIEFLYLIVMILCAKFIIDKRCLWYVKVGLFGYLLIGFFSLHFILKGLRKRYILFDRKSIGEKDKRKNWIIKRR